ncbi:hypothetical protein AB0E27_10795 [Streptomyces sparsogenes]|uniref:hypothetical protein n=1 Tax=Streptomyces sparsogenes TaxID=67365 RepID=UPI0034060329
MGTGDQDHGQDDVVEPARPPLSAVQSREVTAGLRGAMDDVRRSMAVLAARVWLPLSHGSWATCCEAEFSISRAQAYRLLDIARALTPIHGAVTASTGTARETPTRLPQPRSTTSCPSAP